MAMPTPAPRGALLALVLLALDVTSTQANLFSLTASGTITSNTSGDATIPVGAPWTFTLTYDTTAPDLDFESTVDHEPTPTFGRFTNTGATPAIVSFHYQAGSYEVTINDPADFGAFSAILITFTSVHAIDINIDASAKFPPLAGGPVNFHADFNAFDKAPILSNDGLPTNVAITQDSFDESTVTLLPPSGVVTSGSIASLTIMAAPTDSADFTQDGLVDQNDLARWRSGFGTGSTHEQGDADRDADVDGNDFLIWQRQLGSGPTTGAAAVVPEPGSLVLIAIASTAWRRTAFPTRGRCVAARGGFSSRTTQP